MYIIKGFQDLIIMLSAIATTCFTALLWVVADRNLEELNKTSEKENTVNKIKFTNEFKSDFFSSENRLLFELIEYDIDKKDDKEYTLFFIEDQNEQYFKMVYENIKNEIVRINYIKSIESVFGYKKEIFTTTEIDNLLLGHLEDIGSYMKDKLLHDNMLYDIFSYYVQTCYENKQIKKYIKSARDEDNEVNKKNNPNYESDLYKNFDEAYKICNEMEEDKMKDDQSQIE